METFETAYETIATRFRIRMPDFEGFDRDERYLARERRYKDELVGYFSEQIAPSIESNDFRTVGRRVIDLLSRPVGDNDETQNIVGWRYWTPLRKLSEQAQAAFGEAVCRLRDQTASLETRLEAFIPALRALLGDGATSFPAASRSIVSFLLAVSDPTRHAFIKTTETRRILEAFDPSFRWNPKQITAAEIQQVDELCQRVLVRLQREGWRPRDLIDAQSFFWVSQYEEPALKDGTQPMVADRNAVPFMPPSNPPLNQILYGPPGTGKTYHTVDKALEILDPEYLGQHRDDRTALRQRFDALRDTGHVQLVTFHQSFSYEDFVEGLRASSDDDGQIRYEVEPGIFKRMCAAATATTTVRSAAPIDASLRRIWKMSLGNTLGADAYIFDECIRHNFVLLGYGGAVDLAGATSRAEVQARQPRGESLTDYAATAANLFLNVMQKGDLIVVTEGNHKFRAIGEITGDYRFLSDRERDEYFHSRAVRWLRVYSPSLPRDQLMENAFSQMTLYELRPGSINLEKLSALLATSAPGTKAAAVFRSGQTFGRGYSVRESTPDILRLTKPNGAKLSFDMELLNELADMTRRGAISLEDIREGRVFEKVDVDLEKFVVGGYQSILATLVEYILGSEGELSPNRRAPKAVDRWVLIIDEINRGNIAGIFGELISLIEPSKRMGGAEELKVTLPYSKETFGVPSNMYLIGTMNTADRSLAHMDTALRRRFVFEAMLPDASVLARRGIEEVDGIQILPMIETINRRIELLYDREHTLGHAFFLPLADSPTLECLAGIFDKQILPLLEEYFFEDWSRIRQILGDDQKADDSACFVQYVSHEDTSGLVRDGVENGFGVTYRRNGAALTNPAAYRLIYERE